MDKRLYCQGQHTIANAKFALFTSSCADCPRFPLPVPLAQMAPAGSPGLAATATSPSHVPDILVDNPQEI